MLIGTPHRPAAEIRNRGNMVKRTLIVGLLVVATGIGGCSNKAENQEPSQNENQSGDAKKVYDQIPDSSRLK